MLADKIEIVLPNKKTTTHAIMDLKIPLSQKEQIDVSKSLKGKSIEIEDLKAELKEETKHKKGIIASKERELKNTMDGLAEGCQLVEKAEVEIVWIPERNIVETLYNGKMVSSRSPRKSDENLFSGSLFPEHEEHDLTKDLKGLLKEK